MKFVIDKTDQQNGVTFVTGKTSVGTIKGIWKYTEQPAINDSCHIELSIKHPCELSTSHRIKMLPCVCLGEDQVIFQGICEDVDEDVYYIRFDIDWLEMLEINTIATKKKIGDFISFSANVDDVEIYPYTL